MLLHAIISLPIALLTLPIALLPLTIYALFTTMPDCAGSTPLLILPKEVESLPTTFRLESGVDVQLWVSVAQVNELKATANGDVQLWVTKNTLVLSNPLISKPTLNAKRMGSAAARAGPIDPVLPPLLAIPMLQAAPMVQALRMVQAAPMVQGAAPARAVPMVQDATTVRAVPMVQDTAPARVVLSPSLLSLSQDQLDRECESTFSITLNDLLYSASSAPSTTSRAYPSDLGSVSEDGSSSSLPSNPVDTSRSGSAPEIVGSSPAFSFASKNGAGMDDHDWPSAIDLPEISNAEFLATGAGVIPEQDDGASIFLPPPKRFASSVRSVPYLPSLPPPLPPSLPPSAPVTERTPRTARQHKRPQAALTSSLAPDASRQPSRHPEALPVISLLQAKTASALEIPLETLGECSRSWRNLLTTGSPQAADPAGLIPSGVMGGDHRPTSLTPYATSSRPTSHLRRDQPGTVDAAVLNSWLQDVTQKPPSSNLPRRGGSDADPTFLHQILKGHPIGRLYAVEPVRRLEVSAPSPLPSPSPPSSFPPHPHRHPRPQPQSSPALHPCPHPQPSPLP